MRLCESKIDKSIPVKYKPKKLSMSCKVYMLNTKVFGIKNHQWINTLKKVGHTYMIWKMIIKNLLSRKYMWQWVTMKPKFMSSKDSNKEHTMCSKSDSNIIMIVYDTHEIIQELFDSLLHSYQIGQEQSMKGGDFIFDCVSGMYYLLNKISFNWWIIRMWCVSRFGTICTI